jgi:phosphatidylserine/phosphatidylglycerophosphate/cardiolipin synthase-like enzyme
MDFWNLLCLTKYFAMLTWIETEAPKYMPMQGYTIPWPTRTSHAKPGDAVPEMQSIADFRGHAVEALLTGKQYIDRLFVEMEYLINNPTNAIFWIHGWYFQLFDHVSIFTYYGKNVVPEALKKVETEDEWNVYRSAKALKSGRNRTLFADKLREMEEAGVDVRVIGWIAPINLTSRAIVAAQGKLGSMRVNQVDCNVLKGVPERIIDTFYSLLRLRREYLEPRKVIFNVLTHPLGGAHAKFVIAGNNTYLRAFTGGVDLAPNRNSETWPDVTAIVEGKAATQAGEMFRALWNEISSTNVINLPFKALHVQRGANATDFVLARHPTHYNIKINNAVLDKPISPSTMQDRYVQLYRTYPVKRYASTGKKYKRYGAGIKIGRDNHLGLRDQQAIGHCISDLPYVWTPPISFAPNGIFEFKTICYKAVDAAEQYICIVDQDVSNFELIKRINKRIRALRAENKILKVILLTEYIAGNNMHSGKHWEIQKRLVKGIPDNDVNDHVVWGNTITHAKVMLIDDKWVSIGSANCMRRSFYTDIEMGVSIMHQSWVLAFRKQFWGSYCGTNNVIPDDIVQALGIWSRIWRNFPYDAATFPALSAQRINTTESPNLLTAIAPMDHNRYALDDPDGNATI